MSSNSGPLVLVTGASGYVAGVLVDQLLQKGYRVRGTVRSLADDNKVKHLKTDLAGIELFEADLLKEGSFDKAVVGIEYLFHTASPFQNSVADPQKDLVDPAVNGTINILKSALAQPTLKTVILTSSIASIFMGPKASQDCPTYNDTDWNTTATLESMPYPLSKVMAERKAWELVEAHNKAQPTHEVKLITICPSFVMGPPHGTRVDGVSVSTVVAWMDGTAIKNGVRPRQVPTIDVRDVAFAHIAAAEKPEAHGRYIVSSQTVYPPLDLVAILKKQFPQREFPDHYAPPGTLNPAFKMDPSRTEKELGIQWTPLEKTLKDMADKLIELKIVPA